MQLPATSTILLAAAPLRALQPAGQTWVLTKAEAYGRSQGWSETHGITVVHAGNSRGSVLRPSINLSSLRDIKQARGLQHFQLKENVSNGVRANFRPELES